MKKNYTHIEVLLDRSGSMSSIRNQTIAGINTFVKAQQALPLAGALTGRNIQLDLDEDTGVTCKLTLIQFAKVGADLVYNKTIDAQDINAVQPLTWTDYTPHGCTPLIQAACKAIDELGASLSALPEPERPDRVIFVLNTDGEETENGNPEELKRRITTQERDYNWQFIYLGANQNAIGQAQAYGVNPQAALTYAANSQGTMASYEALSDTVSAKRFCGDPTRMYASNFVAEDRAAQTSAGVNPTLNQLPSTNVLSNNSPILTIADRLAQGAAPSAAPTTTTAPTP